MAVAPSAPGAPAGDSVGVGSGALEGGDAALAKKGDDIGAPDVEHWAHESASNGRHAAEAGDAATA